MADTGRGSFDEPEHLVDKFLDWIEELRSAMSLAETDRLVRNELRTRMLFD